MIIALVNSKGGVGKSTLAGNLAGWLQAHGKKVIVADCDTQASSSEWLIEAAPEIQVVRLANADEVLDELPSLGMEADYVIADGPGSQTETSRALLMWADLAIIPCKASMFEVRALEKGTAFVRQAQAIRKGPPEAIAVLEHGGEGLSIDQGHAGRCGRFESVARRYACHAPSSVCGCPRPGEFCLEARLFRSRCGKRNRSTFP